MAKLTESEYRAAQESKSGNPYEPAKKSSPDGLNEQYRSICKTAVVSAVFTVFALLTLLLIILIPELGLMAAMIAIFGVAFGAIAMLSLRKYPEELIGQKAAKFGLFGSIAIMAIGIGYYGYIYATEVPEGCQRINFTMLKPDKRKNETYPAEIEKYDGKKVFLKGFVRPSDRKIGLEKFLLVGDFGTCCFGGTPKLTDMVAIELKNGLKANYSFRVRRIAGTFRLHKSGKAVNEDGVPNVIYTIEADYIK